MIEFKDIKRVLESLPYGIDDVKEDSRLIEDFGLEEEDIYQVFYYLQFELECDFPEDDVFYRFAGHMPVVDLVEICNTEHMDPFD